MSTEGYGKLQDPKMVVLGLVGIGLRYGFEMEEFVARTNMRLWAKIGMSTIYKTLKELEREGAVAGKRTASEKGPPRLAYSLTAEGRRRMVGLIEDAMSSREPVYSDRIAGLVFAPLMGADAVETLERTAEGLQRSDSDLRRELESRDGDVIAEAVIGYYREVYAAERRALKKVSAMLVRTSTSG
ncbi:MAG: hypothetical protein GC152_14665 [Alphaproteobacteria bacterium]|nr:hypothetical protein [Alphaproteobacteria bacterium]